MAETRVRGSGCSQEPGQRQSAGVPKQKNLPKVYINQSVMSSFPQTLDLTIIRRTWLRDIKHKYIDATTQVVRQLCFNRCPKVFSGLKFVAARPGDDHFGTIPKNKENALFISVWMHGISIRQLCCRCPEQIAVPLALAFDDKHPRGSIDQARRSEVTPVSLFKLMLHHVVDI